MFSSLRSVAAKMAPSMKAGAQKITSGAKALEIGQKLSSKPLVLAAGGLTGVMIAGQTFFGSADNFYDHRFTTRARPRPARRRRCRAAAATVTAQTQRRVPFRGSSFEASCT